MQNYKNLFPKIFAVMDMPVVIGSFDDDEVPIYPFIEYHRNASDYFDAENATYHKNDNWQISLYSKKKEAHKHWFLVEKLESLLDNNKVCYSTSEDIFFDDVIYTTIDLALPR